MSREALLTRTLVELTGSLVEEFDLLDLLTLLSDRCVEILDVSASGLMLVSASGTLRRVASSSEAARLLEVFEEESDEGPCPDCYRSGEPVINADLAVLSDRWPRFAPRAVAAGFRSVHAVPMRVRGTTIGALNLFRVEPGAMAADDVVVAQALADVATVVIIAERAAADAQTLNDQLQTALTSRIVIEQAKGVISESLGVDMEQAFSKLRAHARNGNLKLSDVARSIVERSLLVGALWPVAEHPEAAPPAPS